jgi:site-specific recombinase XerD
MIQRARLEQQDDTPTITDDPVLFEKVVEAWANEKKQSAHTKNGYLNKTARFVKWLSQDRQKRGISALPENMRTITKAEFVRYKNDILTPGHEIAAGLGETSIIHYLVDLRTMFIYAGENHELPNPTDSVTLPRRRAPKEQPKTTDAIANELIGGRLSSSAFRC